MIEPMQEAVYRLCGIEQPEWHVTGNTRDNVNVGLDKEPSGAKVALRWIKLLNGRAYQRTSDGPYDLYVSEGSSLRVQVS